MALGRTFTCDHCSHIVEAWDEGDPYYVDPDGVRHYAYHPDPERELCTDVEGEALCLACGDLVVVDSNAPLTRCPRCAAEELVDAWELEACLCPYCRKGRFREDESVRAIS